jgi:hypothetical protein
MRSARIYISVFVSDGRSQYKLGSIYALFIDHQNNFNCNNIYIEFSIITKLLKGSKFGHDPSFLILSTIIL